MLYSLLFLASFTTHNYFAINPCCCIYCSCCVVSLFKLPSSISLYRYIKKCNFSLLLNNQMVLKFCCHKKGYVEHSCSYFCADMCFHFLAKYTGVE